MSGCFDLTRCWACICGSHYEQPVWHTWADEDDVKHALETGQKDPSDQNCGCFCAQVKE